MLDTDINNEFIQFGDRMNIIMICTVLNFIIPIIPSFVSLIFIIMSLGNIKRINFKLNNPNLQKFRTLYMSSIIFTFISSIVLIIVMIPFILLVISFMINYSTSSPVLDQYLLGSMLTLIIIILVIALLIVIITGILQMNAWSNMTTFFRNNQDLFPPEIINKCIEGSNNLKTAGLCTALAFLVITGIIGFIFQILGYSQIAKLKDMSKHGILSPTQQTVVPANMVLNYCPYCGEQVQSGSSFCMKCGEKL